MKIGLHSVSYSGTWGGQKALNLKDFIIKAATLGFDSVELAGKRPHASPLDYGKKERLEIKELIKEQGLELCCMASYHDFSTFFEHSDIAYME
ncbi:MAG: hypothetical protein J7L77_03465 [Clostridiales bacterium]|nr:hypothetical protein [Clostridiales bacterium]